MISFKISIRGVNFLVCCFGILLAAAKPMAYAACFSESQDDCENGHPAALHHVMRRSIQSFWKRSDSLKVDFIPLVYNVTYYNPGDRITFLLNLTHNQSVSIDMSQKIKVEISSQYLAPVSGSITVQAGNVSGQGYNSSALSFNIATLNSADEVSVTFDATVKDSIQPLTNLYFTALVWGQDTGNNNNYYYGQVSSVPTQYAVFPTVVLTRTSYDYLSVGKTTGYSMTITLPKLNFSLLVEITTNINDFSFMELHNVKVKSVGSNIKTADSGSSPNPLVIYDSSEGVDFNDRATLDFGNLTILGDDKGNNNIVIEYNVTIRDHTLLANNSKHWVGAGMRSGYQMLWVGQEALYVYKSEPSLIANLTTRNESYTKRYLIGDRLVVDWVVQHTYNTSYEDAENVTISFNSNSLKILSGTYRISSGSETPLTLKDNFSSNAIEVAQLAMGKKINGSLVLEVSNNISPLETLNIFLELRYKNIRGDEKQNTTFTVSPPFVAGVPVFCLKHNASTNQIRIGGRAKFFFEILMRRLISTVKVEVILPVNGTSIMSLVYFKVNSVGKNIQNHTALSKVTANLSSTVGEPKLYDRGVLDFGTVGNEYGVADHPDNKIAMEFEIIVNDHANVTNRSKHWVGVGVRGGKRMMWIGDVALIADVPLSRRPVLQVSATCTLADNTQLECKDATSLERSSRVYFNGTVSHAHTSQQYADNVNVFWMMPPYVNFLLLNRHEELSYQHTQQGPKFSFDKKLHFLDQFSFSVEGNLDPDGLMPPGDNYAVSPIQLSYSPYSLSAVFGAPLVPVSLKFTSPGKGAPEVTPSDLPETYKRGFLLDSTNDIVYICQQSNERTSSSCFSTSSNEAVIWTAMDQQVCHVIGQDGSDLYGIACNNRAYMRKRSSHEAWYGIANTIWEDAKTRNSNITESLVTIEGNNSHSFQTRGTVTKWGANMTGVYMNSGGDWTLKAQWKCCGK